MSDTGTHRPLEVTTPTETTVAMTRRFAAPRALVFDAFTKPALVTRWLLGPDGWTMPVCEIDLRAGGAYRYRWRSDDGEREFGVAGTYREVVPPERIVHTEKMDGMPGEAVATTTFVERDGETIVTMTIDYGSRGVRDIALESGMTGGVEASFGRLERTVLQR